MRNEIRKLIEKAVKELGFKVPEVSVDEPILGGKLLLHPDMLVLSSRIDPNSENKSDVNHKDGNKLNNNIDNLEWCSRADNMRHSREVLGNNYQPTIEKKLRNEMICYLNNKYTFQQIAEFAGISNPRVSQIITRNKKTHSI